MQEVDHSGIWILNSKKGNLKQGINTPFKLVLTFYQINTYNAQKQMSMIENISLSTSHSL